MFRLPRLALAALAVLVVGAFVAVESETASADSLRAVGRGTDGHRPPRAAQTPPAGPATPPPGKQGPPDKIPRGSNANDTSGQSSDSGSTVTVESSRSYVLDIVIVVAVCGGALYAVCKSAHRT